MSTPVLFALLVAVAAIGFVIAPLLWPAAFNATAGRRPRVAGGTDDVGALERVRNDLYARIVELDFEHSTGKTDEEEYRQDRADLKRQALAVLRTLDTLSEQEPSATRLAADVERAIQQARARRAAEQVLTCATCGRSLRPDDRFCSGCGAPRGSDDGADAALEEAIEREILALRRGRQGADVPRPSGA